VAFGVSEYTLVFRRALDAASNGDHVAWTVARPSARARGRADERASRQQGVRDVAALFVAPIYSTLALDDLTYEQFLWQSGALAGALALLAIRDLSQPEAVEMARREIASLVIAAEVQHIVDGMSA
jgi:hypothetical protein